MDKLYAVTLVVLAACGTNHGAGNPDATGPGHGDGATPTGDGTGATGDAPPCGSLHGVIHDFVGVETPGYHGSASPPPTPHPDFEHAPSDGTQAILGLVQTDLDTTSRTPVLNTQSPDLAAAFIQSAGSFAEWYTDTPNVSAHVEQDFPLVETPPGSGVFVFDTTRFFPIDNLGWGIEFNGANAEVDDDGTPRNFHFTTEFHASFVYTGGEKFTFRGDDDVWVFVNNKLAIDIGGIHSAVGQQVDFDAETATDVDANDNPLPGANHVHPLALGITTGNTYDIDFFQAERHVTGSNFRLETSIDCFGNVIF